jgi:DNA-binding PadR family transcriptional regulator
MSVRDGILAILTLGPAYGLQLHGELRDRAPHRRAVNVGQIYGTLERLATQGLVIAAGRTDDGLPQYALTAAGDDAARLWLTTPLTAGLPEWTEMLDQIVIGSSIDSTAAGRTASAYRRWWEKDLDATRIALERDELRHDQRLALLAREAQAIAAIAWLGSAIATLVEPALHRGYSEVRPRRGRKAAS